MPVWKHVLRDFSQLRKINGALESDFERAEIHQVSTTKTITDGTVIDITKYNV